MSNYIHGYTNDEQNRLSAMQSIINGKQISMMDFTGVSRVLDVGCGLGQFTRLMAQQISNNEESCKVLGIEKDERQLRQCFGSDRISPPGNSDPVVESNSGNEIVEFRQGNAARLPLTESEVASFDLVHCRFLLEHVSQPDEVIEQFARALKPSGQVIVLDDDHELLQLSPECPELMHLWTQYWKSYRLVGCDPLIGRRVPELFSQKGISVTKVDTLFYGACANDRLFDLVVDNILNVAESAQELLAANGMLSESEWDDAYQAVNSWRRNKNATVWYSLPMTIGKLNGESF